MFVVPPSVADLTISTRRLVVLLAVASGLILAAGYAHEVAAQILGPALPSYWHRIDLDAELSVSSWFSSAVLAFIALLAWLIGMAESRGVQPRIWGWRFLALGFVYLSLDEMIALHEQYGGVATWIGNPGGVFYYGWTVAGLLLMTVIILGLIPFVRSLPRSTALRLLIAGAIYVGGALGMEMIEGVVATSQGPAMLSRALMCVEETMEIVGMILGTRAMLLHIADYASIRLMMSREYGSELVGSLRPAAPVRQPQSPPQPDLARTTPAQ